ncbi:divalent metal cation transporter [bacterium]|nr:divalent metal cation transporter [bacterium]MCE5217042.1 divalent metal cation transporter [bacterium]
MRSPFPSSNRRWRRLTALLAIAGPGIITATVDNDAGGVATYSLAGGNYGYGHLWALIPIGVLLFIIQEMSARLGAMTGKGLADLIRENFGLRMTFWLLLGVTLTNLTNTMGEFAGVASAAEIFGLSRYIAVPLSAVFVWVVVVRGNYKSVEKVFFAACLIYLAYPISGILAKPDWKPVLHSLVVPGWELSAGYVMMLIGIVGTTIAPWMQFYQQAAVVDKGITAKDYKYTRLDVLVGCVFAVIIVLFIMVTCSATIHAAGKSVESVEDAAQALFPLAGPYCAGLFAFGLLNASLFAASILPLATAYQLCEGIGWERGLDHSFREAPAFYTTYTALIVLGAGLVLLPNAPLLKIMYLSQVLNGVLLPLVLVFMLRLINDPGLMGDHTNSRVYNVLSWACVVAVSLMSAYLAVATIFPSLGQ